MANTEFQNNMLIILKIIKKYFFEIKSDKM